MDLFPLTANPWSSGRPAFTSNSQFLDLVVLDYKTVKRSNWLGTSTIPASPGRRGRELSVLKMAHNTNQKSTLKTFILAIFSNFHNFQFLFSWCTQVGRFVITSEFRRKIKHSLRATFSIFFSFSRQNRRHIWRGQTRGKSGCEKFKNWLRGSSRLNFKMGGGQRVYIGNIPSDTRERDLEKFCKVSQLYSMDNIHVINSPQFLTFCQIEAASWALELTIKSNPSLLRYSMNNLN